MRSGYRVPSSSDLSTEDTELSALVEVHHGAYILRRDKRQSVNMYKHYNFRYFKCCYGLNGVLPKFICWGPNPSVKVLGDGACGRKFHLDEVTRVESPWWDQCPSKKRKRDRSLLALCRVRGHSKRRLFVSQENGSHQQPNQEAPCSWTSSL